MGTVYIRKVDDELKSRLRRQAAKHGRSMEEEARVILRDALRAPAESSHTLAGSIHAKFAALGGIDLVLPPREILQDPQDFEE
jgi:antitoxin FitA